MPLYTHNGVLLNVNGELAAGSGCCCGQSHPGCVHLPRELKATLSGLPSLGLLWFAGDLNPTSVLDPFSRIIKTCTTGFGTTRYFSSADYTEGNREWTLTFGTWAPGVWYWNGTGEYTYYADSGGFAQMHIDNVSTWDTALSVVAQDCLEGPGSIRVTASLSGINPNNPPPQIAIAAWEKTVTLGAGETLRDHFPLTLDPVVEAYDGPFSSYLGNDYLVSDLNCFTGVIPNGTLPSGVPGMVLDNP